MNYLLARLAEKSTIGVLLTLILGAVGVNVAPQDQNIIVTAVVSVLSAIGIFTKERKK